MKRIDAEKISLEDLGSEEIALSFGGEKFLIDQDTLCDLTYRMAAMLSYLENQEEACANCRGALH